MDHFAAIKQRADRLRAKGKVYTGPTQVKQPSVAVAPPPVTKRAPPEPHSKEVALKRLQARKHKKERSGGHKRRLKALHGRSGQFKVPTIFDLTVVLGLVDWCIPFFSGTGSCLSNFARGFSFFWRGHNWYSSEQAYQWAKVDCLDIPRLKQKLWSKGVKDSPIECKRAGKEREVIHHKTHKTPQFKKWEECQVPTMKQILMAKFSQCSDAQDYLCASYPKYLAETTADSFWGIGVTKQLSPHINSVTGEKFIPLAQLPPPDSWGTNTLGLVLMELRVTFLYERQRRKQAERSHAASSGSAPQASTSSGGAGLAGPAANAQVAQADPIPVITLD